MREAIPEKHFQMLAFYNPDYEIEGLPECNIVVFIDSVVYFSVRQRTHLKKPLWKQCWPTNIRKLQQI